METQILSLIRHHAMTDDFNQSTRLTDIMDSLDIVELSFDLEKEFSIIITSEELSSVETVGDIISLTKSKRK